MRSGKQHYVVKYADPKTGKVKWYPGDCLVKHREEEIFPFRKKVRRNLVVRKFSKESSVFAAWKLDDAHIYGKCIDHDLRYWKTSRFVRDKKDYLLVIKAVKKYFPALKAAHLYMCSRSKFPATYMNDFTSFARKANLVGGGLN